jgi:phenylalanyl-tRNA synthetase beta chain
VDPRLTDFAINFAINDISKNCLSSKLISTDCINYNSDKEIKIDYQIDLIKKLCGVDIEAEKQISALKNAGYSIEQKSESSIKITPPKYRYDIKNCKDIAFDLMKMLNISHFENLPLSFQHSLKTSTTKNTETINKIKLKIASQGYNEVITLPFQDENLVKITESGEFVEIANPISSNAKTMRKSIITGLFDRFQENFHLTKDCLNIFEVGSVFLNNETISKNIGFLSSDVFSHQSYKTSKNSSIEQIKNDFLSIIKDVFK